MSTNLGTKAEKSCFIFLRDIHANPVAYQIFFSNSENNKMDCYLGKNN
jgi:hypothetical protein